MMRPVVTRGGAARSANDRLYLPHGLALFQGNTSLRVGKLLWFEMGLCSHHQDVHSFDSRSYSGDPRIREDAIKLWHYGEYGCALSVKSEFRNYESLGRQLHIIRCSGVWNLGRRHRGFRT